MTKAGTRTSRTTLATYSTDFGWQERVLQLDRQTTEQVVEAQTMAVLEMNERQSAIGKALQLWAGSTVERELAKKRGPGKIEPRDVAALVRVGQHAERLAMGEATSREEIALRVYGELVPQIVALFLEVNVLADPDERRRRFAVGADSLTHAHARETPPKLLHGA